MSSGGRVVIVAGGTGALGRAVALAFLEAGHRVVVTYRQQAEYDSLASAAGAAAARLKGAVVNVTEEAAVARFVEQTIAACGSLCSEYSRVIHGAAIPVYGRS